jgi:hypothetical protein
MKEEGRVVIQHCPGGLFPHINSGFERKPFFPEAGKPLVLGCRAKAPAVVLAYSLAGVAQAAIEGKKTREDGSWAYFTFTIDLPCSPCLLEYSFSAGDAARTNVFTAESVLAETAPVSFSLKKSSPSTMTFVSHLCELATKNEPGLPLPKELDRLVRLHPDVRLWRDRNGVPVQAEFSAAVRGEALYGFGEKFDRVNQVGLSPLSYIVEQFANQREKTYLPIPFFFTDAGVGFFLYGTRKAQFFTEATGDGIIAIRILTDCPPDGALIEAELFTGSPPELIRRYTELTGAPALPPRWAFGPWMSSNGWSTQSEAEEQIAKMNELDIPATVMVLEAWSDEETFYIWNDAQYTPKTDGSAFRYEDFTFPADGKWPDPKGFCDLLERNNVKLVL